MKLSQFFKNHNLELNNKTLLVAVSGGADSMALLTMMLEMKKEFNLKVIAAHVDHNLREDSYLESELLQNFAKKHNFELIEKTWDKKFQPLSGVEAAARDFRYDFFAEIIKEKQVDYLLTAHHGDDLIENMLLKLIRSGNIAEFNSLKPVRDFCGIKLLRPLLEVEKKDLEEFCRQNSISYIEDETNETDFTIRNRMRHHIIPKLKEETRYLIDNANRLQQGLDDNELALVELVKQSLKVESLVNGAVLKIGNDQFDALSDSSLRLVIQNLIKQYFRKVVTLTEKVDLNENLKIELPQQVFLQVYQGNVFLVDQERLQKYFPGDNLLVELEQEFDFAGQKYVILDRENSKMNSVVGSFCANRDASFQVGRINSSNRLILKNKQHQLPKKRFAEQNIPEFLRPYQLTIFSNETKQPLFITGVYQNQDTSDTDVKYYVYQVLKKDKEK